MIKRFKDISQNDVSLVGGKGASLGELMANGFPCSNGFVLTTEAYNNKSDYWINDVLNAFDELDTKFVAVRSSATKEDGIDDSFAGQFDTFLFIDKRNLIENIQKCHKSINNQRMKAYCNSKGINREEIKIAVVIQKMINSEIAGVAFTINPVTGEDQVMIEAGWGLGEAVVSGMITPDNYLVGKKENLIDKKSINTQTKKLILNTKKGGIKETNIEVIDQNRQKLSDTNILLLSKIAKEIENHYDKPIDVEWAIEKNKLFILQARPITSINIKKDIKYKYKKIFTRDTSLIMQAAWINGHFGLNKLFDFKNKYENFILDYMHNGTISIRKDEKILGLYEQGVVDHIGDNEKIIEDITKQIISFTLKAQKINIDNDINNLLLFIKEIYEVYAKNLMIAYYSCSHINTPKKIKDIGLKRRDQDYSRDIIDTTLRKRLIKIFPKTIGYENAITYEEIINENIPTLDELKDRQDGFVYLYPGYEKKESIEEYWSSNDDVTFIKEIPDGGNTIKGEVAVGGYKKGTVQIIYNKKDISKFIEGNILISPMTTPNFLPAMIKASAITTDEGGMTCHAAIVARELSITCIVGTKCATQVLKDGDIIEVDADNGIIYIEKKNN